MKFVYSKEFYAEMNRTVAFRTEIAAGSYRAHIAAGNVFRVWLNDRMIACGPMRAAHGHCNVLEIPLDVGKKAWFTVEIAGYNINTYSYADDPPYFGAELFRDGKCVKTAEDFLCFHVDDREQKVNKYSMQRFFAEVYRERVPRRGFYCGADLFPVLETMEVKSPILLDCAIPMPDFAPIFPLKTENAGNVRIDPAKEPYESFWFYPSEHFCTRGFSKEQLTTDLSHEVSRIVSDGSGDGKETKVRFPYNATGFIAFDYEAEGEATVYVTFDELPFDQPFRNSALNAVKFSTAGGKGSFLSFEPYTMQYAKIFVFGKAEIGNFRIVSYENPSVKDFPLLPDKDLDLIFRAGVRTFRQNAVDILTDCPSRERAGWLCDSFFTSRAEKLLTGESCVEQNMLRAFLLAPEPAPAIPAGMLPMCYPADHLNGNYIANWALWFVLELREYRDRSGDTAMIAAFRRKVYALLDFLQKYENSDGLLEDVPGWVFIEWSKANEFVKGVNYPSNMLYSGALNAAAELYNDGALALKAAAVRETIRKQSFNGQFFADQALRDGDGVLKATANTTETCQYYAFYFGVATERLYPELFHTMFDVITRENISRLYPDLYPSNAFIGNVLRLDFLARNGRVGQTISECRGYYLYMAERTGTLWEHDRPEASCNHGFASVLTTWLAEYYHL